MTPELACGVLSYRDEPGLVEAVQSLLTQDEPVDVVVVNSGGGRPAERLAEAGIDVRVVNRTERLYPGAVRNIAIAQTSAPYIAFLAADCLALPGWVAGRLREHRAGATAVASCLTNAEPESRVAWASLLLLHHRQLPSGPDDHTIFYGLSYDRKLFGRFGLFDETLRAGEDTDFNSRLWAHETFVRATDVRTAHRYPTALSAYLRDALGRGALQAAMQGALAGTRPQRARIVARAAFNIPSSLRAAWRAPVPERRSLLGAWPLMVAGAVAYAAGAAFARASEASPPVRTSHSAAG